MANKIALAILAAGGLIAGAVWLSANNVSQLVDPYSSVKAVVKEPLVDPNSAQFKNISKSSIGYCGEVNAKNRMGGYTGFKRFHAFQSVDGSWNVGWAAAEGESGEVAEILNESFAISCP